MKNSAPASDWLERLAIEAVNERTLAGLAVGVSRVESGDTQTRFVALGRADAKAGRAVDAGTVFRIGSISKTMTAIAVMQLVEEAASGSTTRSGSTCAPRASRSRAARRP